MEELCLRQPELRGGTVVSACDERRMHQGEGYGLLVDGGVGLKACNTWHMARCYVCSCNTCTGHHQLMLGGISGVAPNHSLMHILQCFHLQTSPVFSKTCTKLVGSM
jgi:hypothetical protein